MASVPVERFLKANNEPRNNAESGTLVKGRQLGPPDGRCQTYDEVVFVYFASFAYFAVTSGVRRSMFDVRQLPNSIRIRVNNSECIPNRSDLFQMASRKTPFYP